MFIKRFISLFLIALFISLPAIAQTPAAPEAEEAKPKQTQNEEAKEKLRTQAFELLDAIVKDTERLTLPENRIYVSLITADLLWPHDEEAARTLFKHSLADLRAILSDPVEEDAPRAYRQKMERAQLRQKVLFALAEHDARMARSFMMETRPPARPKSESGPRELYGGLEEDELELGLAIFIARHDPAQALEMARETLAQGTTYSQLPNLVAELQKQDGEGAASLTRDILTKLKTIELKNSHEAIQVASRILQMADESQQAKTKSSEKKTQPLLSEQSTRELAELIISALISRSNEPAMEPTLDMDSTMPLLEKYAPARAKVFRRKMASQDDDEESDDSSRSGWREYEEMAEKATPDELLAAAGKAEAGLRENYYRQAAFKLGKEGQTERARQIITEHITEPQQRQYMLAELDKLLLANAAEKGKLAEARQLLARARTNEARIDILTQIAMSQKDKKIALQLLEEARTFSSARPKYSRQMLSQMQLARAYATVDAAQSFAILEPSIDQLNDLIAAAILLGEFFGEEEFVRDDELMVQPFVQMIDGFQQQFGKDLALLAQANFTRTKDIAEKFQRPEVRLLARLLVAQSVLAQKKDEADAPKPAEDKPVAAQTTQAETIND